jgi:uncharacterized protein
MKRLTWLLVGLLFAFLGCCKRRNKIEVPRPDGYVNDFANLISAEMEGRLEDLCLEVEKKTTAEIAVVTVETTDTVPVWYYTTELGNAWGVGQKDKDNGIVILVCIQPNEYFIATGNGFEGTFPDSAVDNICRHVLLPYLNRGEYDSAFWAVTEACAKKVAAIYGAELN